MSLIVTPRQLTQRGEWYHQMASLLSAGVGMVQALEMVQRNPPGRSFHQPLSRLIKKVNQGGTVAESMLGLGSWLPSFDLALIQAQTRGDVNGMLDRLSGCREHPACVASVRANASNPRRHLGQIH